MAEKMQKDIEDAPHLVPTYSAMEGKTVELSNEPKTTTERGLKSRHAQMIALGGTIGTGLFLGSGQALNMGGPVVLVACYLTLTLLVFGIVTATTEMSSYLPVPGSSVAYYGHRFHSSSLGFALGWIYWYIFSITVPAEITAAALVVQYWDSPVPPAAWITIFLVIMVALNCMPVGVYGETEFWFASIKVVGIIGLLIMALVLIFGGGPNHERLGFHYWTHPAPANEYLVPGAAGQLSGFFATLCFSLYAFAFAPELLVVTGGEMQSPRRNLPVAGERYFYRLVLFYLLGALAISMIVPSDDPSLLGSTSDAGSSPWAIAASNAGIRVLPSIINAVILASALSAGSSYLYLAGRAMYSLAVAGNAPRIFLRCTPSGVPYVALSSSAVFTVLAYLNVSSSGTEVFNWFVNLINTGAFQSWIAVCVIYIQFRKATTAQGIEDLPYRSRFQPYMSYICAVFFTLLMLLNGFKNFLAGHWNTANFLSAYIGIPVFVVIYLGHRVYTLRTEAWVRKPEEVDLVEGLDEILAREQPSSTSGLRWYQVWRVLFE